MNLLTHNEAREYLRSKKLPDNFRKRLENFLEFEDCSNCGGVQDMNFVFRDWWVEEPSWCSDCVESNSQSAESDKG